ncbi:putative oligomerization/nucleic acid binding protein [Ilumatobacter fluminis]|uniref:Putative oligomerization/nucleic acid binding protein n=1 Tax=Ilumatobacter fluminis TaxID=467091 RepID=A0A4R7I3Z4_9ACTN|nr:SHOCT domain-containing protein [Ilumatobacter fluminis]TDT17974.1 putative oligomerization/nucleic acid binding protein [Ilumatobacter fluminis]
MPRRRIGRPGLVGTMARTAVVAGTANATVGAMNRRQANKQQAAYEQQAQQAQLAELQAQQAAAAAAPPPPPPPAPAAGGSDLMAELQQLGDMKNAGLLTDDEFAAAKAKLLA